MYTGTQEEEEEKEEEDVSVCLVPPVAASPPTIDDEKILPVMTGLLNPAPNSPRLAPAEVKPGTDAN